MLVISSPVVLLLGLIGRRIGPCPNATVRRMARKLSGLGTCAGWPAVTTVYAVKFQK